MSTASYAGWSREQLIGRLLELEKNQTSLPLSSGAAGTAHTHRKTGTVKPFNFYDHPRRKIALKFCYSGWEYGGLAFQADDTPLPTVEGVLFDALAKAHLVDAEAGFEGCGWERCGRTDKGVSGAGQVASLWIRSALPRDELPEAVVGPPPPKASGTDGTEVGSIEGKEEVVDLTNEAAALDLEETTAPDPLRSRSLKKQSRNEHDYVSILNRILPDTIRVFAWSPVPSSFSARFSCSYRHYKYFFSPHCLDIPRMQDAASRLVGEHDFRNLCKLDPAKQITSFKRNVHKAHIEPLNKNLYVFNLVGSAFLYHQVRHIMALLFLVGSGLEPPSIISNLFNVAAGAEALKEGDSPYEIMGRKPEYQMADGLPLMLWNCGYPDGTFTWRTTGKPDDVGSASGGGLYHELHSILTRSHIHAALNEHFLLAAATHHPAPVEILPLPDLSTLKERKGPRDAMNIHLGGGSFKRIVKYVPVLERNRLDPVEVANERWRMGKGSRKQERKKAAGSDAIADGE